jgi:hypothetical protein
MTSRQRGQNREGLRWRGPTVALNYRPVLLSERALQNNNPATVAGSRVPDGCLTPRRTGQLTVSRNITLTLALSCEKNSSRSGGVQSRVVKEEQWLKLRETGK